MRLSIKTALVLAFTVLMFLHVTEPKKKRVYHKHHRLKVVFGG